MATRPLHDRLDALGRKIGETRDFMKRETHLFRDEMHQTADELKERYRVLRARLDRDRDDPVLDDRHLSDLEKSVRQWLDSVDEAHRITIDDPEKKP
ncbi:MAG: 3-ketoacyl-ACP reductase [Rhodobacteraceae bacterium]|nr:3-ketoacyl-ACP reductase [Paracoccaceae bacterium]